MVLCIMWATAIRNSMPAFLLQSRGSGHHHIQVRKQQQQQQQCPPVGRQPAAVAITRMSLSHLVPAVAGPCNRM